LRHASRGEISLPAPDRPSPGHRGASAAGRSCARASAPGPAGGAPGATPAAGRPPGLDRMRCSSAVASRVRAKLITT